MLQEAIKHILKEFIDEEITSVGVISSFLEKEDDHENNVMIDSDFSKNLKSSGYDYFPTFHSGRGAFLIPNISRENLISFGKQHNQSVVFWGEKEAPQRYVWHKIEDGKIRGEQTTRHAFVCPNFS